MAERIRRITAAQSRLTAPRRSGGTAGTAARGMSLSYRGGNAGGISGTSKGNRTNLGRSAGGKEGTRANRAYRSAAIRALRGGATISQANRAGYRNVKRSAGESGG